MGTGLTAEQQVIQRQLSMRAILWDMKKTETMDVSKLFGEAELFQVRMVSVCRQAAGQEEQDVYQSALQELCSFGMLEAQALLVTEDAGLAEYVYKMRDAQAYSQAGAPAGMAVVYYEPPNWRSKALADMIVLGFEEIGIQFLVRVHKRRNHLPWNILYTKRTCVREITMADLDELYALYEGEGITDYTEPLFERQEEEEYTKSYIANMYYYYGYGMWVVRDRQTGALLGRAGIERREVNAEVCMELGYIIGREYQNKGYATEVCSAIMDYAKEELAIRRLHCFIHPCNTVSVHLARKLGFELCADQDGGQEELAHWKKCLQE